MKSAKLHVIIPLCILAFALVAFLAHFAAGTLSAFGINDIIMMCPLGAIATMLATKTIIPRGLITLAIAAVLFIIFGRAFCGWVCPMPVVSRLRDVFAKGKKVDQAKAQDAAALADEAGASGKANLAELTGEEKSLLAGGCTACASKRGNRLDARHFVLGSALLSTLIFGFPVFCLVCPVGLTFATLFLVANLFLTGDASWMVLVAPLIRLAEVVFFRKWCHALCPLGALMSLVGKANKTFVPTVDTGKCLETSKGATCGACVRACPENIDLRYPELSEAALSECTKCRLCVEACPTQAISMPFMLSKAAPAQPEELEEPEESEEPTGSEEPVESK